ncbi:MAG: aldehyde ferredoxin oxidoreductase family protein [Chloroflexota bacterium]|nr:aldehyde ferredoxin oxidoreductase family protein [Chloroflexota bacterium]
MKGVMGKLLFVDLTSGEIRVEEPDESLYRDYVGGYGIGAKILYERMKPGADPLGPENIFGIMTGPLTGTQAVTGSRFTVLGKSPKTGTWGDANCGGFFAPALKFSGYDGVFFTGISEKPVYLFIDDGKAELRDANHLWGKDAVETEEYLKAEAGKGFEVTCIGTAGEQMSLIAAVMSDRGRAAARSGLGAVMGSKKLKAVVAGGQQKVPVADEEGLSAVVKAHVKAARESEDPMYQMFTTFGTSGGAAASAFSGDSPVKNWKGVGQADFPTASQVSDVALGQYLVKKAGCWHCVISCGGHMRVPEGPYKSETHRPEYETLAAFGTMTLADGTEAMIYLNELSARYGVDTISAGVLISFAMECYEQGIITKEDTGGLDLTWGNTEAVVALMHQIGKREGLGAILADGVKVAAEKIGKGAEQFAIHVHGEEVPMHDPRFSPGMALTYQIDATPGRHTQGGTGILEMTGHPIPAELGGPDKHEYSKKGLAHRVLVNSNHVYNAAGVCLFSSLFVSPETFSRELEYVTGEPWSMQRQQITGERIATLRHAFNLREGLNPVEFELPKRIVSGSMLAGGPDAGVEVDNDAQRIAYFELMGWDQETAMPPKEALLALGLDYVAADLYSA